MCKALQDWAEEERKKGKMEGNLENLRAIINNLKLSAEKAMEVLDIPPEEREKYLELIQENEQELAGVSICQLLF